MKQKWSKHWKESKQPRKQRKYVFNAPLHIARNFLGAPLSKELRKKYSVRTVIIRKGDKVKILRGQYAGRNGAVENVQIKNHRIAVEGVTYTGRDGKKKPYLLHSSKVLIVELNLDDKERKASIERASKSKTAKTETGVQKEKTKTTKGVKQ